MQDAKWDSECNLTLMHFQLEYMESLGFDRVYGVTQIYPAALEKRFGDKVGVRAPRVGPPTSAPTAAAP